MGQSMNLGGNLFFLSLFFEFRPGIYFGDVLQDLKATIFFPKMLDYDFMWKFQFFKRFSYGQIDDGNNVWVIV